MVVVQTTFKMIADKLFWF